VGRTAARLLFDQIRDLPADPVTLLPTEIIIRRSCGCLHEAAIPAESISAPGGDPPQIKFLS